MSLGTIDFTSCEFQQIRAENGIQGDSEIQPNTGTHPDDPESQEAENPTPDNIPEDSKPNGATGTEPATKQSQIPQKQGKGDSIIQNQESANHQRTKVRTATRSTSGSKRPTVPTGKKKAPSSSTSVTKDGNSVSTDGSEDVPKLQGDPEDSAGSVQSANATDSGNGKIQEASDLEYMLLKGEEKKADDENVER